MAFFPPLLKKMVWRFLETFHASILKVICVPGSVSSSSTLKSQKSQEVWKTERRCLYGVILTLRCLLAPKWFSIRMVGIVMLIGRAVGPTRGRNGGKSVSPRVHFLCWPFSVGLSTPLIRFLNIPRSRLSTVGFRAFSVFGLSTWNDLPLLLRQKPSLDTFKSNLRTLLFEDFFLFLFLHTIDVPRFPLCAAIFSASSSWVIPANWVVYIYYIVKTYSRVCWCLCVCIYFIYFMSVHSKVVLTCMCVCVGGGGGRRGACMLLE